MNKFDKAHMQIANIYATLSHCKRRQVGAVMVSPDNRILCGGYNGNTKGKSNACEGEDGLTLQTVHHAEMNLLGYSNKFGIPTDGNIIFVTTAPCINCAKAIEVAGISKVVYKEDYNNTEGIDYLKSNGISVIKY